MMLRGEDRRRAEFPDIFTVDSLNEDHKGNVPMLILRLCQGKIFFHYIISIRLIHEPTNRDEKAQYNVAFCNKNVQYCPVNAVALYLFYQFHVEMESWSDFSDRLASFAGN